MQTMISASLHSVEKYDLKFINLPVNCSLNSNQESTAVPHVP